VILSEEEWTKVIGVDLATHIVTLQSYVESFPHQSPAMATARRTSLEFGLEPVTLAVAQTLTWLATTVQAKAIVEVGTGAGVSTVALMDGMNDHGVLTTIDHEAEHHNAARRALQMAGYAPHRTRFITGEALNVLPKLTSEAYDLVFVDADYVHYPDYFEEGLKLLRPGGVLVLYHVLLNGQVADESHIDDDTIMLRDTLDVVRAMEDVRYSLAPLGDGLLMVTKVATQPSPDA